MSRRGFLAASGAVAAVNLLPGVAFSAQAGGERTSTATGTLPPGVEDWFYLPVEVPEGVAELEVVYSYDEPEVPDGARGNACDIGVFGPHGHELGDARGFRGWSGGFRDRFTLSASAATPGYLPGPIEPGTWHVVLGPYTVAPQGMRYRVEVTLRFGEPGAPAKPNPAPETAPARDRGRAWYRGDNHLHTVHSDGRRTPAELVEAARAAGLDFITSTEHNTPSASWQWGEHATDDLLILNGEEVTTRSGHWPAIGLPPGEWIDWRYRSTDPRGFRRFVDQVHDAGGLVVAAHPFANCFGCTYEFDYALADLIEVWNKDWTAEEEAALHQWDGLLRTGHWIPLIGNSDAHNPTDAVGSPHTVVLADSLRREDLLAGLRTGRSWLAESASVQLEFTATAGGRSAGIGETLPVDTGTPVTFEVSVSGVPGTEVRVLDQLGLEHSATGSTSWTTYRRYTRWARVEVRRGDTAVALTNPIFLGELG
ncbi:CehA/McbA family metallohydrolase [Saccharopolyspora flava]|uniref:CehA/McbA family metallohydrolase n=1 Tax=Saccharopolyspora flava TaxID=95161 RepID=UPI000B814653|nr:CehA/McbA family metallohydrolase [Saccharopolyspora flava]